MFFVLDNYDSFTYNLVQYLGELGTEPVVRRNDEVSVDDVLALGPEGIVVSPGPGRPAGAGISVPLIRACAGTVPVLGVCLGHQAIGEAFGGRIIGADRLMHGKATPVAHDGGTIFRGLPSPFEAMRYHSLVVDPACVPDVLAVTAWSDDRPPGTEIMALAHRRHPVWGVQFHPESVGTAVGHDLMANFVALARGR
jgi:anthranilate synthase component II